MGRVRVMIVALVAAWVVVPGHAAQNKPDSLDLSVKTLVATSTKYVAGYEQEFAFLLADESYAQTRLRSNALVETRVLESEMFLTFLPADDEWVAVRDVLRVDGEPVPAREDLRTMLGRRSEFRGLIAQIVDRNARYNIGGVTRTFNEPTLPLLLMDAKRVRDVKFERGPVVKDGAATLVTLLFSERGRPTLVRGPEGSVQGSGELVVEAGTGVVRRTRFELEQAGLKVRLATTYARDPKLGLWLPATFTERYEASPTQELVLCEATYSNYRRFEVNARIK